MLAVVCFRDGLIVEAVMKKETPREAVEEIVGLCARPIWTIASISFPDAPRGEYPTKVVQAVYAGHWLCTPAQIHARIEKEGRVSA